MKSPNSQIFEQLEQLFQSFIVEHDKKYQCLPQVAFDVEWLSSCQARTPDEDNFIEWKPVAIDKPLSFDNVETGLNVRLNTQYTEYFTQFYSESVPVHFDNEYLELLFAWNEDDFERLQQNVIGHVLMKRKLKQQITLFFAVTDRDDMIISIHNDTGEIWLEKVGCEPHQKLAGSMNSFLTQLSIAL